VTRIPFIALVFACATMMAVDAFAQQQVRRPPPEAADLEGGDTSAPPPMEPEEIPELKPRDDITSIKPLPAELPDRTIELLGDTTQMLGIPLTQIPNYRDDMRKIVEELATFARGRDPNFTLITFGGTDLFSWSQREYDLAELKRPEGMKAAQVADTELPVGFPMRRYQQRVDGFILDGFFCAPVRVPLADVEAMRNQRLKALSVDHCDADRAQAMFDQARRAGIVAHIDTDMDKRFASIPKFRPIPENPNNVMNISTARSMLINLDNRSYGTKDDWLLALKNTNFDVLIVDGFYNGNMPLTKADVSTLKFKKMGAKRLVLAWIEISQASDDKFYWQREWRVGNPSWIHSLDRTNPGKYHVEFWNPAWKAIVGRTFAGLMDLGFDGIVISGVEGYRRWEYMTPVN
jgi:cysteinyl-tRNA synthetase, unknown class